MKKYLLPIFAGILAFSVSVPAEDLSVMVIGGEAAELQPQDIDNMRIGESYRIDGFATFKPLSFDFYDSFAAYNIDSAGDNSHDATGGEDVNIVWWDAGNWFHPTAHWENSGTNAEFAFLVADVVNLQKKDVKFMENTTVTVYYDGDEYEFAGWVRQFNHDYYTTVYRKSYNGTFYSTGTDDEGRFYTDYAISPENEEAVGQMYSGHYVFGCTLPNTVVEEKTTSLRMVINLGGNELTYYIRG